MKDQKIIDMIRQGNRSSALEKVYLNFPKIKKMILSKGGSDDEAKDIFQESVIIFYNNVLKVDFMLTSAISTYLYSVSYNLWLKRIRDVKNKEAELTSTPEMMDELPEIEDFLEQEAKFTIVEKVLKMMGDKCMSILKQYYYKRLSMKEIAVEMGYSSDKIAKNQKYKCLEKARRMAAEQLQKGKEVLS